jgi:hypothetical protein
MRGIRHDSEVLIRQIDGRLATLRVGRETDDIGLAERIAAVLRRLVVDTTSASAADRARVRAAVHFFVVRRDGRIDRRPARPVADDIRIVNEIVRELGRVDLVVESV